MGGASYSDLLLGGGDRAQPEPAAPTSPDAPGEGASATPPAAPPSYSRVLIEGTAAEPQPRPPTTMERADQRARSQNAAGDFFKDVGGAVAGAGHKAVDMVTGRDRREFDIPELPSVMVPGQGELGALLALGQSDAAQRDILKRALPDAQLAADKFGNTVVTLPHAGEGGAVEPRRYYLNRPGLSGQDVDDAMVTGLTMAPFARAAGVVTRGAPLAVRAAGTAAAAGAGSVARDLGAGAAGSQQGVDPQALVLNSALGGALELMSPAASGLYRLMRRDAQLVDPSTGMPTRAGLAAFERAGIDPASVTRAFSEAFQREAGQAADPAAAAVRAQGQSLPVPVPVSRGDATRVASDQMFESLAEKGAYGGVAAAQMRDLRARQQAALRGNLDAIQDRVASRGGVDRATVTEPGQGGAAAQRALVDQRDAAMGEVNTAYEWARAAPGAFPQVEVQGLRHFIGMGEEVADRLAHAPKAQAQMTALDQLAATEGTSSVRLKALEDWRRQTSTLARESGDATEAAALRGMVKRFDLAVPEMVKDGLLMGDQDAVTLWSKAIQLRKAAADKFEGKDLVQDLVQLERRSGEMQLKVPPEQAANYIFGLANAGSASKANLARDLGRMRELLGEDSAGWNALREEAWTRIARAGEGPYSRSVATPDFSGAKFARALDNELVKNRAVMTTLFDSDELALMQQLKQVALRTTTTTRGGDNTSNTAVAASTMVQRLMAAAGGSPVLRAGLAAVGRPLQAGYGAARAIGASADRPVPRAALPPGATGTLGTGVLEDEVVR